MTVSVSIRAHDGPVRDRPSVDQKPCCCDGPPVVPSPAPPGGGADALDGGGSDGGVDGDDVGVDGVDGGDGADALVPPVCGAGPRPSSVRSSSSAPDALARSTSRSSSAMAPSGVTAGGAALVLASAIGSRI